MFRRMTFGILGAAALAASVVLLRSQRVHHREESGFVPPGESVPSAIHLDRLRELGI